MNWKFLIKVAFTCLAIFLVVRQVDFNKITEYMMEVPVVSTISSIIIFNVAKFLGSLRLNSFFKQDGILLSEKENLRLYYKGLFYNLFLPGGIGGDGYKMYYIHNNLNVPVKRIFNSIFWDRVSGAVAILFLSLVFGCLMPFPEQYETFKFLLLGAIIVIYPAFKLVTNFLYPTYKSVFISTTLLALAIQILQACIAVIILVGIGVPFTGLPVYILIFYVSTLAAILPITVGGIGLRELIFIEASAFTTVDQHVAVAFSVVYFVINAVCSFVGNFIKVGVRQNKTEPDTSA